MGFLDIIGIEKRRWARYRLPAGGSIEIVVLFTSILQDKFRLLIGDEEVIEFYWPIGRFSAETLRFFKDGIEYQLRGAWIIGQALYRIEVIVAGEKAAEFEFKK